MNKTYRQPLLIKIAAWGYILLATPIFVILLISYWQGTSNDTSAYIGIPVLFMPFYIGAWWLVWHFRGKFILTNDGILLQQLSKETFLRYQDIHTIAERDSLLLPYLLLGTNEHSLSISFQVDKFSDLYANLKRRVAALQNAELESLPITLQYQPGYVRQIILAVLANAVFTGVLSVGFAYEEFSLAKWFSSWSIFLFLMALIFWWNEWSSPYRVLIDQNRIEAHYLFRKTRIFSSRDITRIEREHQVRRLRYSGKIHIYPLVITFANGERLQLEEGRIWSFGYSPDRLYAILTQQF